MVALPSQDEGYVLPLCAHPLSGEALHLHRTLICKNQGMKINSITISPSVLFTHTQDLDGVPVTRGLVANVKPIYRKPPCCSSVGRRAKLLHPPSFIVKDHPLELAGKLP
jgi:hypothetical protein